MVFQTEKAMEEAGDKIDASEKAAVQEKIDALKAVVDRTANQADISDADIDALKSGKEDLMNAAQKLFQKMYEQTQGQAGAQGAGPDMSGAGAGAGAGGDGRLRTVQCQPAYPAQLWQGVRTEDTEHLRAGHRDLGADSVPGRENQKKTQHFQKNYTF